MANLSILLGPSVFFYVFFNAVLSPCTCSIDDSGPLLQLKKSFVNAEQSLGSWKPQSDPCSPGEAWVGVICSAKGVITSLHLAEMNLSGKIDVDALTKIPAIRSLTFMGNSFVGPIPEFNRMGTLKAVYLSGNQFSGEISADFFLKMQSLKKLSLSDNNFTGPIPPSLAQLPLLKELYLNNNRFSGEIPLFGQKKFHFFNVSNNELKGEIPVTLSKFNASSFAGNAGLCGDILRKPCAQTPSPAPSPENSTAEINDNVDTQSIAYGLMGVAVFLLALMIVAIFILRRRQEMCQDGRQEYPEEPNEIEVVGSNQAPTMARATDPTKTGDSVPGQSSRRSTTGSSRHRKGESMGDLVLLNDGKVKFGMGDLMKAAAEVLGNGTLGSSYKAVMANGLSVVVKRMKDFNKMDKEGFDAHTQRLATLRHVNVLTPIAYHYRKEEKLLVSEHVPGGSLQYLLHGDRGANHAELNWRVRLKIVQGIARGLGYLQTALPSHDLPHGNLKSSNVLLGPNFEPLLVDYGFSPLINTNVVAQTLSAYNSPEAAQPGGAALVSSKCDVYCLGIIILEILTGKFPSKNHHNGSGGGTDLVRWVKSSIAEGRESELLDPELETSSQPFLDEMKRLLHVAAACTETNPQLRPDIGEAIGRIERITGEGSAGGRGGRREDFDSGKTLDLLPSLRDGYADESPARHSTTRNDQITAGSRNGGSFAFDIS